MSEQEPSVVQSDATQETTESVNAPVQATEAGNAPESVTASTEETSAEVAAPLPSAAETQTDEPNESTPEQTASQPSGVAAEGPSADPVPEPVPEPAVSVDAQAPVSAPEQPTTQAVETVQAAEPAPATTPVPSATDHYFLRLDYLINNYISTMVPGKMLSQQDAINTQRSLLEMFRHVLGADITKAKTAFEVLFSAINKHRDTVFAESNVYRYFGSLKTKLSPKEFELFNQLTHLFISAANPSTREAMMKQIDLNVLARNLDNNKQFMNLSAFFNNRL